MVTLSATVSPTPDGGTVAFESNGGAIDGCSAQPVDSTGTATCSYSADTAGDFQLGAAYSGDQSFTASSTAAGSDLTVTDAGGDGSGGATSVAADTSAGDGSTPGTSTTADSSTVTTDQGPSGSDGSGLAQTTIVAAPLPSTPVVGAGVSLGAQVTPAPDGGTVAFQQDGQPIAGCSSEPVDPTSGDATCSTSYGAVGTHSVTASFSGDASFAASTSTSSSFNVVASSTAITVGSASPASPTSGQSVTLTASVDPVPDGGTIAFENGGQAIADCGAQAVNAATGVATCTTTFSAAGIYGIDAAYSGDGNYLPSSTPSSTALTVAAAPNAPVTQSDTTQPSGSTGATGATGATGSDASTPSGSTGTTGSSGATGSSGSTDSQGSTGTSGSSGSSGATGSSGSAGSQGSTGTSGSTGSNGAAPCPSASSGSAAPLDLSGTSTSLSICGGVVVATSDGKTTAASLASVSAIDVKGGALTIDASGGSFSMPIGYDGPSLTVTGSTTESDWTLNGDGTGSVVGGGVAGISFNDVASVAASGQATLHGPSSNSTWDLTGPGSGTLTLTGSSSAGTTFAGFADLSGAPNNDDAFVIEPGGSLSGLIDGGAGGDDSIATGGHPDSVVSTPTGAGSGTLVVDGASISYTGLEDPNVSATNITIDGQEDGEPGVIPQGDLFKVSPYTDGSVTPACGTAGNCIQVQDFDALTSTLDVLDYFVIAGTSTLTINGGAGSDKTEFTGNFDAPNIDLTVNTESIKVDSSVTITAHNVNFNAAETDDGTSLLGIDTTLLGDEATIELDSAGVNGNTVDFEASATNAKTEIAAGSDQLLLGLSDNLFVDTTTPFLSKGEFTIAGLVDGLGNPQVCTYSGTSGRDEFTGVSGCIGVVSAGAEVDSVGILEDQSLTGFDHAALQLIYGASITIGGNSSITATGDVTLASTVNVIGTANGKPLAWDILKNYSQNDVVTYNDKLYKCIPTTCAAGANGPPNTDTADWASADGQNAALAASVLVASAATKLTGASTISAANGDVKITASLTTNITTEADATQSKSGAAFAVGVVVTDSEAYVDSTAGTPVLANNLTVSADTNNTTPTTGKASPGGANDAAQGGTGQDATKPSAAATSNSDAGNSGGNDAAKKADGMSKTSDGDQPISAALGVTVDVATTKAYIASSDDSATTISTSGGTDLVHAGSTNNATSKADAGNVAFAPDALTLTSQSCACVLTGGSTYYYEVTALYADDTAKIAGSGQFLDGLGTLLDNLVVDDAGDFDASGGKFIVASGGGITGVCNYKSIVGNTLEFISGCTGTSVDTFTVTTLKESMPSPEKSIAIPGSDPLNQVTIKWTAVPDAVAYEVYRSTTAGQETFLDDVTSPGLNPQYVDQGFEPCSITSAVVPCSNKPPTDDDKSGVGIAVGVTVADVNTTAYIGNNVAIDAKSVTVEAAAPSASTYATTAISGAGGTSVGVAGSIAVLVVVNNSTSDIEGTTANASLENTAVPANNTDLSLTAASNLTNTALATAKQASDGSTSGVGASFALNVVNDTTTAGLPDGSTIGGVNNLTISATDTDTASTTANGGASAGSGSIALSAQVAITLANVTTTASVGTGADLTISGKLMATANQTASAKTIALGATKGGSATIGLSLALALVNDNLFSQLARNLTAGGTVAFAANGVSSNDTEATASSAGAPGKSTPTQGADDGQKNPTTKNAEGTVNQKADSNLSLANDTSKMSTGGTKDSGTSSTPAASSGEGGGTSVTVAAAVAIAIVNASALSGVMDDLTVVTPTTGSPAPTVSFGTSEDTDSTAKSTGKAVMGSSANIGAAVSINVVKVTNVATIGMDDLINTGGLSLTAVMPAATGSAPDGKHSLDTEATAGAGNGKFSIAGALALEFANIVTNAEIKANSTRGPPDQIKGNVSLTATASVSSTVKAGAMDTSAGTVGIGAGAAVGSVNDATTASIDDGALISGAKAVTLSATTTDTENTSGASGTSGNPQSDAVFTADAAISLPTVITSATIAGATSQTLDASGAVSVTAKQTASATTMAKADASTGDVVVGLALALATPDDEVTATDTRELEGAAVTFSATGTSSTTTEADASAAGAKGDSGSGDGSGKTVNGKGTQQLQNANGESATTTGAQSKTQDTNGAKATTGESSGSSGNEVTVAGAAAINIVTSKTQASLGAGVSLTATGLLTIKTSANTDASATGSGKETAAGSVGIGAGVSVNSVDLVNTATTNTATISSNGLDLEAGMTTNGKDQIQFFNGTDWETIDSGTALPDQPTDGEYFQLTKAIPPTTTVMGGSQTIDSTHTTLTVASTLGFFSLGGTFTIAGISGTCSYSAATPGVEDLPGVITGITGCTGTPVDKATVTVNTATTVSAPPATTTVSGASQNLAAGTLNVKSALAFPVSNGAFTVAGIAGTCQYTGSTATSLTGITNCGGTPADGALVTYVDSINTTPTSTTVNESSPGDLSTGTLTVKSVAAFATAGGQFLVNGIANPCTYTGVDAVNNNLTGITGCTGTPAISAAVTLVIAPLNTLLVASTAGFDPLGGQFTATGLNGTCTYTGALPLFNEFEGVTGCSGIVADQAAVQYIGCVTLCSPPAPPPLPPILTSPPVAYSFAQGVYQWHALVPLVPNVPGYWTQAFTSGPIFPTSPSDGQYFELTGNTNIPATLTTGLYKFDSSMMTPVNGGWITETGLAFPEDPAPIKGDFFQLTEHYFLADGQSGAGAKTVGIAGALGLNIISNDTSATIGGPETIAAGTGAITISATNNEEDAAKADSDAKGGSVGIGASVGVNVANNTQTIAAIPDGATVTGGKSLTVSATGHHTLVTEDKAGSDGGVAISPSVSIGIATDVTTATIGTGNDMSVTGDATIAAKETIDSDLKSDASAGGDNVKIGASVAVNAINATTSATLLRNLSAGGALSVTSATESSTSAQALASTKGADDAGGKNTSADQQASSQVSGNDATSGKTDGLPAAGLQFDVASEQQLQQSDGRQRQRRRRHRRLGERELGDDLERRFDRAEPARDCGDRRAHRERDRFHPCVGARVRSVGRLEANTSIGAGVGLNVENVTNTASVGAGDQVGGDGVTVEAVTPDDKESDFTVWGIAAAGGKNTASVAAAIGVQVLNYNTTASIGDGAIVNSTGDLTVSAAAPVGLQNLALSGGLSTGGTAVGGAVAVNVLSMHTLASIGAGSTTIANAAGALSVTATAHEVAIPPDPSVIKIHIPLALSSIALGGSAGGGDAAVTGSFVVDVYSLDTEAYIAPNVQVNNASDGGTLGDSGQSITVSASDDTHLINVAGAIALTEGSAGVGVGVIVDVITKDVKAYIGDSANVFGGGDVSVTATSTEELFEVSAEAAASTDGAAVAGGIIVVVLERHRLPRDNRVHRRRNRPGPGHLRRGERHRGQDRALRRQHQLR